jgi:NhaP-type Na+/H+ and K+/H+ antiporter
MASLNRVEDIVMSHMYRQPICENIVRMNDFLTFEHETRLPDGNWLLIIYQYNSKSGLTVNKIFDRDELKDVTEKYKANPIVAGAMRLISEEIGDSPAAK